LLYSSFIGSVQIILYIIAIFEDVGDYGNDNTTKGILPLFF